MCFKNVKNTGYFNIGMENEYGQEITLFVNSHIA